MKLMKKKKKTALESESTLQTPQHQNPVDGTRRDLDGGQEKNLVHFFYLATLK